MNTKLKGCLLSLILLVAVTAVHAQTRLAEANTSADMDSAVILDSVPVKRNFFRKFLNYFNDAKSVVTYLLVTYIDVTYNSVTYGAVTYS